MARIEESRVKETSGAYTRLFGITELGRLISRIQSTVISSGTELERIITSKVKKIECLDEFLKLEIMPEGVVIATKNQIKKSKSLDFPDAEPDFLIFKRKEGRQAGYVVELKDGHLFDTKKSSAERRSMRSFIERSGPRMGYRLSAHFCCFNQDSKQAIVNGFKRKISIDEAMTGREFCELLEIDYDEIIRQRQLDQPMNVQFFLHELLSIDQIRVTLSELLRNRDD